MIVLVDCVRYLACTLTPLSPFQKQIYKERLLLEEDLVPVRTIGYVQ